MIGETISHYPALWDSGSKRDSPALWIPVPGGIPGNRNRKRNKIIEKLRQEDGGQVGEGGPVPACAAARPNAAGGQATAGRLRSPVHDKRVLA